ncbi:MAG: hypothetical protein QF878_15575 [SAR202 cluster bacterium]|jgi:hypothetical protein|nr:hypothetical protein [SAR202 cluster bacterium]
MTLNTAGIPKVSDKKGDPPPATDTNANLEKPATGQKVPIQVFVPAEVRRQFKGHAADRDMKLNSLFEAVWAYYRQQHG